MQTINNNTKQKPECVEVRSDYYGTPALPEKTVTTMAYVPFQTDTTQYTPEDALKFGTLFANLNKPFSGGKYR